MGTRSFLLLCAGSLVAAVPDGSTEPFTGSRLVVEWNQRGVDAQAAGRLKEASQALRTAEALCKGEQSLCASVSNNLGSVLYQQGSFAEAKILIQKALDYFRPAGDPASLASSLGNLAATERGLGRFAESRALYREALDLRASLYGATDSRTLMTLNGMALLGYESGDYKLGEALARRELELVGAAKESLELARAQMALALNLRGQGKVDQAVEFLEQVVKSRERILGMRHVLLAEALNGLGFAQRQQGRITEAASSYQRALVIFQEAGCDNILPKLWNNLAQLAIGRRNDEATRYFELAVGSLDRSPTVSAAMSVIYSNYATFLLANREFAKARRIAQRNLEVDRANGSPSARIGLDLGRAGLAAHGLRRYREAITSLEQALEMLVTYTGDELDDKGVFALVLGGIRHKEKDFAKEAECYKVALDSLRNVWGEGSSRYLGLIRLRAQALRQAGEYGEAAKAEDVALRSEYGLALRASSKVSSGQRLTGINASGK